MRRCFVCLFSAKNEKLLVRQRTQAVGADVLALEDGDILSTVTENTGRLIFLEHNRGPVYVDLKGILFGNVQRASEFDGQDDTPQFVYPTDDSGGFHVLKHFLSWFGCHLTLPMCGTPSISPP